MRMLKQWKKGKANKQNASINEIKWEQVFGTGITMFSKKAR